TELNWTAAKFPNLFICTSLLPRFSFGYTKKAQELMGEILVMAGEDKLIWGSDWSGSLIGHKEAIEFSENIQIGEEVQRDYHYPAVSQKAREKWAGLNLAKILNFDLSPYRQK
ncbi:amidohydrolase family protein, partial [Chloroflexota bacterium]